MRETFYRVNAAAKKSDWYESEPQFWICKQNPINKGKRCPTISSSAGSSVLHLRRETRSCPSKSQSVMLDLPRSWNLVITAQNPLGQKNKCDYRNFQNGIWLLCGVESLCLICESRIGLIAFSYLASRLWTGGSYRCKKNKLESSLIQY